MRIIVVILIALAFGKVGTQIYLRQTATAETVIVAYRDEALTACQRAGFSLAAIQAQYNKARLSYSLFGRTVEVRGSHTPAPDIELTIGRDDIDVRLWQTSHRNWSARYRDPFLIVKSPDPSATAATPPTPACEYDIKHRTARLLNVRQPATTLARTSSAPAS